MISECKQRRNMNVALAARGSGRGSEVKSRRRAKQGRRANHGDLFQDMLNGCSEGAWPKVVGTAVLLMFYNRVNLRVNKTESVLILCLYASPPPLSPLPESSRNLGILDEDLEW